MSTYPPPDRSIVHVASIARQTEALGPGKRAVLWVQGCLFRCPGCIAPEWLAFEGGEQMTPHGVVEELLSASVTGITFSGGEPMQQASALAEIARLARQRRELDIICFTGYRYEKLRDDPPNPQVADLLDQIDVLIDGPYVAHLNAPTGLRGSSNQRIIYLTPRLRNYDLEGQERQVEVIIGHDAISMIGIPNSSVLSSLDQLPGISRQERKRS